MGHQPLAEHLLGAHGLEQKGAPPGPGGTFYDPGHQLSPHAGNDHGVRLLGLHRRQTVTAAEDHSVLHLIEPGGLPAPLEGPLPHVRGHRP